MKSKEQIAKSIVEAMGEDVMNPAEMEATEGGHSNVLSDCTSTNNCQQGNCSSNCGSQSTQVPIQNNETKFV